MKRMAAWIGVAMLVAAPALAQVPNESPELNRRKRTPS